MARLIRIPEICDSFLHLSVSGEAVLLRDFSTSPTLEPEPFCPEWLTRAGIEELINRHPDRHRRGEPKGQKDPGVKGAKAVAVWHRRVVELNAQLVPANPADVVRRREVDAATQRAGAEWWEKVRRVVLVLTALVGLAAAVVALLR